MNRRHGNEHINVENSSGNVFADIELPKSNEHLVKAMLVARISAVIETRGISQRVAAKTLGIDQPKVSALLRGKFSGYSTDRLFRFLVALGQNVDIVVRPKPKRQRSARIQVTAA